jgi:MFS family permease
MPTAAAVRARPALYTRPFVAICTVCLLGFAQNFLLQPILPLLIVDLGGDATLVGITFAVFSVPSVLLRPAIGRVADRRGVGLVLFLGTAGLAIVAPFYLVPAIGVVLATRVVHGLAWAAFNTGAPSTMARHVPGERRLEASGVYDLMPGIATLVMPSAGLLLLHAAGFSAPLLLAAGLAVAVFVVSVAAFGLPRSEPRTVPARAGRQPYLEPSAVLPMLIQLLFMSGISLFLVFPPVLAVERGIPVSDLAIYYPIYGITLVAFRGISGRLLERVPRPPVVVAGSLVAATGLAVAGLSGSFPGLVLGGTLFAAASGFSSPATMASVLDHAPPDRLGAAMGTYTLGFQFGSGFGAALWGTLVGSVGFAGVFLLAAVIQLFAVGVAIIGRARLTPRPTPHRVG